MMSTDEEIDRIVGSEVDKQMSQIKSMAGSTTPDTAAKTVRERISNIGLETMTLEQRDSAMMVVDVVERLMKSDMKSWLKYMISEELMNRLSLDSVFGSDSPVAQIFAIAKGGRIGGFGEGEAGYGLTPINLHAWAELAKMVANTARLRKRYYTFIDRRRAYENELEEWDGKSTPPEFPVIDDVQVSWKYIKEQEEELFTWFISACVNIAGRSYTKFERGMRMREVTAQTTIPSRMSEHQIDEGLKTIKETAEGIKKKLVQKTSQESE